MLVLTGTAVMMSGSASPPGQSSAPSSWKDLPPIVLEDCIAVQKVIARNLLSSVPGDYFLVTTYEEKANESAAMGEDSTHRGALDVYLVYGVLLPENQGIGIVHHTALVVKVSTTDVESSTETFREWVLIDTNGDRKVDRGVFRETVTGEGKRESKEVEFPEDRLQELQAYYEAVAGMLDSRAENGPAEGCVKS